MGSGPEASLFYKKFQVFWDFVKNKDFNKSMEILPFLLNNVIEPFGATVLSWLV